MHNGKNYGTQKHTLTLEKMGDDWANSDRPKTRFEISVKRDGLRAMEINSVDDLFGKEWAIINLLPHDWLRILEEPKKKGKEFKQKNHPVWDKMRSLLRLYFPAGSDDAKAEWKTPAPVSCDADALEKQALGCLAKALAVRNGRQESPEASADLAVGWVGFNAEKLYSKLNKIVLHTEIKTGITLGGVSSDAPVRIAKDKAEWDYYAQRPGSRKIAENVIEILGYYGSSYMRAPALPVQEFYEPLDWNDFVKGTEAIHLRNEGSG